MSHNCQNLVINCMDFRLPGSLVNFLAGLKLVGNYDIISIAGSALAIANPKNVRDRVFILEQVNIAVEEHGVSRIIIINHKDCGAYGGSSAFDSPQKEKARHLNDLGLAKKVINDQFPQIEVVLYYATKTPGGDEFDWTFERVETE